MDNGEINKAEGNLDNVKPVSFPCLPKRLASFRPRLDSKSKEWDMMYGKIKNKILDGALIGIHGKRGVGKSQASVCLIKYCCHYGHRAMYKKAVDIFLKIKTAMKNKNETESDIIQTFLFPYLLIIDAFEVRGDTDFEDRMLNHIIDRRYDAVKSTIIISNDDESSFKKALGESIVDRMRETGGIVEFDWKSFRGRV